METKKKLQKKVTVYKMKLEKKKDKRRWKLFASVGAKHSGTNKLYLKIGSVVGQRFKRGRQS